MEAMEASQVVDRDDASTSGVKAHFNKPGLYISCEGIVQLEPKCSPHYRDRKSVV